MFVNLFAEPRGQALSYPAVYDLVLRLRKRTGLDFDPHPILHTHRDLPVIAWTVGSAGATLTGQIKGLAPADQVRATFDAWLAALSIREHTETPSGSARCG